MKLYYFFLSGFSLLLPASADLPALPASIEVDFVFPRNDTYGTADNFPIVFAIQNAALAWDFGFYMTWELRNVTPGASSSFVDSDTIVQSNSPKSAAPADPYFIVNYTTRLGGSYMNGPGTYRLSWGFALSQNCTESGDYINHTIGASLADADLVFTITDGGKDISLTDGGPCPVAGAVVGVGSNISGCAHVDNSGVVAQPCSLNIDDSLASSLSAELPPITTSTPLATTTATITKSTVTSAGTKTSQTSTATPSNDASNNRKLHTSDTILFAIVGFCAVLV